MIENDFNRWVFEAKSTTVRRRRREILKGFERPFSLIPSELGENIIYSEKGL